MSKENFRRSKMIDLATLVLINLWFMPFGHVIAQTTDFYQEGMNCYQDLDLPCAVTSLTAAVNQQNLDPEKRIQAYTFLGMSFVILGKREEALASFQKALEINPKLEIGSGGSPKIQEVFQDARRIFLASDRIAPHITHYSIPKDQPVKADHKIDILVSVTDNRSIDSVTLYYRSPGEFRYTAIEMKPQAENDYLGIIPSFMVSAAGIEYYVQARDEAGNVTASASAENPYSVSVMQENPWYRKWWVWGLGAVVIGSSVGVSLLVLDQGNVDSFGGDAEVTVRF